MDPVFELPCLKHDAMFRTAMADLQVARSFLTHHLPAIFREGIDWDSLKVCPTESVGMGGKRLGLDMLYEFSKTTSSRKTLVFVSVEHQRRSERQMAFRMLRYKLRIWSNYRRKHPKDPLPLVASVVVYNGQKPWKHSTQLSDLFDAAPEEVAAQFTGFELVDLSGIPDQDLLQEQSFGLLAVLMKHAGYGKMQETVEQVLQEARQLTQQGKLQPDLVHQLLLYALTYTAPEDETHCTQLIHEQLCTWEEEETEMARINPKGEPNALVRLFHEKVCSAHEQGMQRGMLEMLRLGVPVETVAKAAKVSVEEVLSWQKKYHKA